MYALQLSPDHGTALVAKSRALGDAAWALVGLQESDPELAASAAVEVSALEARGILEGGALDRVERALGSGAQPPAADVAALSRLEGLLSTAESRIGSCMGNLDAKEAAAPVEKLAGFIGLATGAVSLVRSIF